MCETSGQASHLFVHVTWMGQGVVDMSKVAFFFFVETIQKWRANSGMGCFWRAVVEQKRSALLLFFSSRTGLSTTFFTNTVKITIIT